MSFLEDGPPPSGLHPTPLSVLVWGENRHGQTDPWIAARYPDGIHGVIPRGGSNGTLATLPLSPLPRSATQIAA